MMVIMMIMLVIMLMTLTMTLMKTMAMMKFIERNYFRRGRDPIVVLGFVLSMLAYFLTFLAIPNTANLNETDDPAFIEPNRFVKPFFLWF